MPKSLKKSSTTQTSISRYFGGGSSKSAPERSPRDGFSSSRGKQKHSADDDRFGSGKRAKLSHPGLEEEEMDCEVISCPGLETKVPSSEGSGLSSSTLERLKGFRCLSEPHVRAGSGSVGAGSGSGGGGSGYGDGGSGSGGAGSGPGGAGSGPGGGGSGPGGGGRGLCDTGKGRPPHGGRDSARPSATSEDSTEDRRRDEQEEDEERRPEPSNKKKAVNLRQFGGGGEEGGGGGGEGEGEGGGGGGRIKSVYTPLEQQYLQIKQQHRDALLAVECGYKYRFFGEDAEIAAKELKIFCHLDHNFMTCSIPTHRLFVHVRRLVAQGHKVGVVKQTETSAIKASGANKNTLFSRQLSGLYTKSTLVGEDVNPVRCLGEGEEGGGEADPPESFLLCVSESWDKLGKQITIGMVAVQPSTGDVLLDCFTDSSSRSELEGRVLKVNPMEILVPSDLSDHTHRLLQSLTQASVQSDDRVRVERRDSSQFEFASAMNTVTEFYCHAQDTGSRSLSSVASLDSPVICCLGPLIHYLREFRLERVLLSDSSFRRLSCEADGMLLSATTLKNLEVLRNQTDGGVKGSLLWVLDHTHTPFGRRLMRKWVSQPLTHAPSIMERQDAVSEILESDSPTLTSIKALLSRLPDLERGVCSIYHQKCSTQEFFLISSSLSRVGVELQALLPAIQSQLTSSLLRALLLDIPDLLAPAHSFLKVLNEKAARSGDKRELFSDLSAFPVLRECREQIQNVLTDIQDHLREVRLTLRTPTLDYITVSGQEFLIEVKNSMASIVPSDWVKISSTKSVSRYQSPFLVERYRKLQQLREQLLLDSQREWTNFLHQFGEYYHTMKQAISHLATVDCLFSLAEVAKQGNYCRPCVCAEREIVICEGRHPSIDLLMAEHNQYVPNDTQLQGEGRRTMIITGPNMGGKSSYIRQVALVCIMSQLGSYVPATQARLGILDGIYTRMGASDNIYKGQSTFMEELTEASEIIARATEHSLVILDELGRGTSTHDGIAIAHATLQHLVTHVKSLTLFVTHYPPLCELETVYPQHVANYHMAFLLNQPDADSQDGEPQPEFITFLYQLTQGAAGRSYGLNVARLADIPEPVLQTAARKARELENTVNTRRRSKKLLSVLWNISDRRTLLDWTLSNP